MGIGRRRLFVALLVALPLTGHLISCGRKGSPPPTDIAIGVVVYSDRDNETNAFLSAARMAVEPYSRPGSVLVDGSPRKITLAVEEIPSSVPEKAVEAVSRLINQRGVVAIVGPQYSVDAIPAGQVAEDSRVPLIAPISTNPRTTAGRRYVFRVGFLDEVQGRVLAAFARETLKSNRPAVLFNISDPFSREVASVFRQTFEKMGGKVGAYESFTSDQVDYSPQLKRISQAAPDVLFLAALAREASLQAVQAREMGFRIPFLGSDGWDRVTFASMPEFEGCYSVTHWSGEPRDEKSRLFVDRYIQRNGDPPEDIAALVFDGFSLLLEAINHRGSAKPQAIMEGLYAIPPYEGVTGTIDFVDTGDPVKAPVLIRYVAGRAEAFKTVAPP